MQDWSYAAVHVCSFAQNMPLTARRFLCVRPFRRAIVHSCKLWHPASDSAHGSIAQGHPCRRTVLQCCRAAGLQFYDCARLHHICLIANAQASSCTSAVAHPHVSCTRDKVHKCTLAGGHNGTGAADAAKFRGRGGGSRGNVSRPPLRPRVGGKSDRARDRHRQAKTGFEAGKRESWPQPEAARRTKL
jgi:hypothetical protein